MQQLQPKWPLKIDSQDGPYEAIYDVAESIHQNFKHLLRTVPGEWPMRPGMGIGLRKFLFDSHTSPDVKNLSSTIRNQLEKYLDVVELVDLKVDLSPRQVDRNQMVVMIRYRIKPLDLDMVLNFSADSQSRLVETAANMNENQIPGSN